MKTDEIKWRILNDTAENVIAWIESKDKRIQELEARLQRIRELPQYITVTGGTCEFPDIGKLGGAYRKRDVDEIIQAELEKKS